MNTSWSATPGQEFSRRRSHRVLLSVPITVTCETQPNMFTEKTQTLVVNAHGALISLEAKAIQGQSLLLKSPSSETRACRVVYVGPTLQGRTQFGIEFNEPSPNFWHITFPPEDWAGAALSDLAETKKK
jgi:PilZ domain